ncbi:hypothetical protein A1O1_09254 [Capronia coronata CBS 617.96]|uniref:RING-type domain-containing protein n=1 Tax=Capronia coronata CBS 617.96 TaxID=1182541 RepID=W9XEH0_9EURO|nr:uncharacterized protein A1O1_09254 [Capronia coronata CBS 617.96]EXJ78852.1 hypothetical protein A1O1_09254 [Capronia coronata CBS 617.96]
MSSHNSRPSRGPNDLTIDLTVDSDSDGDTASGASILLRRSPRRNQQPQPPSHPQPQQPAVSRNAGAPPFGRRQRQEAQEVIDLSDDNSDFQVEDLEGGTDWPSNESGSDSGDVQIVHERPAPPGNRRPPQPARPATRRPSPRHADRGPWVNLPDFLRRSTQFMFGNVQNANDVFLNRLDGIRSRAGDGRQEGETRENEAGGNFIINLDYRQPAFALGGLEIYDRSSETPQVINEPYKAPPAPKEGFIRTFAEDDVVLCPMCGDELATGKGDTKQQVWVVKQCGHVYCGECATNRYASKARKKDKKAPPSKVTPFSECKVDDCKIRLTHNTAMFPIYL